MWRAPLADIWSRSPRLPRRLLVAAVRCESLASRLVAPSRCLLASKSLALSLSLSLSLSRSLSLSLSLSLSRSLFLSLSSARPLPRSMWADGCGSRGRLACGERSRPLLFIGLRSLSRLSRLPPRGGSCLSLPLALSRSLSLSMSLSLSLPLSLPLPSLSPTLPLSLSLSRL